jgi:ATP-binding cassette, subfamily B, bacterial
MACVAAIHGLVPAGLALVIRGVINTAIALSNHQATFVALVPWVLLGLALTVAEAVSRLFRRYLNRRLADEVELHVNSLILAHAARLDVSHFDDPRFQDILQAARSNTASHFSRFLNEFFTVAADLLQAAALLAVLVVIEPLIVVILLPIAVVHLGYQWSVSRREYVEQQERSRRRRWSSYFVTLLTARVSVPEIRLLGLAPMLLDKFRTVVGELQEQNRKRQLRVFLGGSVDAVLTTIGVYVALVRVVQQAASGALTVGDVAVFATAGLRLRSALESVASSTVSVLEHVTYISSVSDLLAIQPRTDPAHGVVPASPRGEIEFKNVSFTYPGSDAPALVDVSLHIKPGETVALVGRNGAGKTTLVKLIARFYDPDSGCVLHDGIDVREMALEHLYRRTAFVFQRARSFEASVADNIAYGDCTRLLNDRPEVERIARRTGADELVQRMPRGYDTVLGRILGEYDLSVGQWQQVAVARAFARSSATLLVLDEPTASLDVTAEFELFDRLRALAKGKTTVLVSHRFTTVRMAERIIVLDEGRVVEQGTHEELMAAGKHYAALYCLQESGTEPASGALSESAGMALPR